ncbi:MAG: hypothetical protein R3197_17450 [Paracoccaceae bacterium]|nr:hypothetical protein [Paracoccaceae bacterium]
MNNNVEIVPAETVIGARYVGTLRTFLEKEAEGLREILALLGDYEAAEAVTDLVCLCGASQRDVMAIGTALNVVLQALEAVPFLVLEHVALSGQGPRDLHAAVRWYGGRIAELLGAFPG